MISIVVLGFGKVGSHLCDAFQQAKGIELVQIYNRSQIQVPESLKDIEVCYSIKDIAEADVYVIALPDDTISEFSTKLLAINGLVVHTSGGVALDRISKTLRRGVLYPLQSFSDGSMINFSEIPICIETEEKKDLGITEKTRRKHFRKSS